MGSYREGRDAGWRAGARSLSSDRRTACTASAGTARRPGPGYWALTRYADVWHVSRHPDLFQSGQGVNIPDMPVEIAQFFGSMIAMDSPRHAQLRGLVQRGFTPKHIKQIDEYIDAKAKSIVDAVQSKGECDFVTEVAAQLPLQIICDMMGIPREDTHRIFELTNTILGVGDPEYVQSMEDLMAAEIRRRGRLLN